MARSRVVKVRVTEAEYSDWTEMALRGSVSLSETIRRAMQGNPQPESPKPLESLSVPRAVAGFTPSGGFYRTTRRDRKSICPHGKPGFAYCPECDQ